MTDYSFMKSGFDNLDDPDKLVENVSAIISCFAEKSISTASMYIKHAKRNGITKEDIKKAMQLETFVFMKRENICEEILKIKEELQTENYDFDEDENIEDVLIDDDELDKFEYSKCDCVLCKTLNTIEVKWTNWKPTSKMERIIKKNIDAI